MTIILAMLQRKGKFIEPQDVAAAVLSQGADETRRELVRLMAEYWQGRKVSDYIGGYWEELAWVCEETARGL